ncbi:MAG: peptide deformylase [Firmicutes bacterium]|nr:peptide deformylase [Bacillota bacterium]
MALLNIIQVPDEILYKTSKPVERFDGRLWQLLDDMRQTLKKSGGAGLAAVQVGYLMRMCLVWLEKDSYLELINPEILGAKREKKGAEGCLSIPDITVRVKRFQELRVRAQDRNGQWFEMDLKGLPAICTQHEIDHMNGILITDHEEGR